MLLFTMTPEEKVKQMGYVCPLMVEAGIEWMRHNAKTVFKTKFFPTFYFFERQLERMGKWTVIVEAESKSLLKKGVITIMGYQTYNVSHSMNENNNGMGIYLLSIDNNGFISCSEYPPHYFNQFRKRYVEDKGLTQPNFSNLVKMVLREHHDSVDETVTDLSVKLVEDDSLFFEETETFNRQAGFKNLVNYSRNGISLGLSGADRRYFNYTTFVSNKMLKDNQAVVQKRSLKTQLTFRYLTDNDPFVTGMHNFEFVDLATRGYNIKDR